MSGTKPHVPSKARIGFLAGLSYPLRGARFVYLQHPRLARLWLPPVVLTAIALVTTTWLALDYHDDAVAWLWSTPAGDDWMASAARGVHRVLEWLVAIVMIALGVVVVALSTTLLAAPFNDALSEAVERIYTGQEGPAFRVAQLLRDAVRTISLELLKLGVYCAVMGPLFVASWALPGIGAALYSAIGFVLTALFLAIDYVDFAAARRGMGARERLGDAFSRWPAMLGLGASAWVLLFVPLLNVLFMPAAVAGATLMFVDAHGARAG